MFNTYKHTGVLENVMIKDQLIKLLEVVEFECKRGCEQSYYEQDRDKWSEYHEVIRKLRLELKKGVFDGYTLMDKRNYTRLIFCLNI